jgi:hypothetical protein
LKDAYAVIPTSAESRGPPTNWWTVTANGIPIWHFPPIAVILPSASLQIHLSSAVRERQNGL